MSKPDPRAAATMAIVDRLDPEVRELVNEYGFQVTVAAARSADSLGELLGMLVAWRHARQRDWLATNFTTRRRQHGKRR